MLHHSVLRVDVIISKNLFRHKIYSQETNSDVFHDVSFNIFHLSLHLIS